MTTETKPLNELLDELDALQKRATEPPYFVASDTADDCPEHRNSGLALVDTGRSGDWPVARLCEWPTATFIAELANAYSRLVKELRELKAENDAAWLAIHRGWNIEPRSFFEAEAPKNGFESPLAMAVHYMWKREAKDEEAVSRMKEELIKKVKEKASHCRYDGNVTNESTLLMNLAAELEKVGINV